MGPYNSNIPARLLLWLALLSPLPSLTRPPTRRCIPFLCPELISAADNQEPYLIIEFSNFTLDLYSGLLVDRVRAWIISLSPALSHRAQHLDHAWEMLVELNLCNSRNKTVGCTMEHHQQGYRGHLGNPLKKINCEFFPHIHSHGDN